MSSALVVSEKVNDSLHKVVALVLLLLVPIDVVVDFVDVVVVFDVFVVVVKWYPMAPLLMLDVKNYIRVVAME